MNEHPWVEAAQYAEPQPIPTQFKVDPITVEIGGEDQDGALLTIIDPTGVKTVVMPPAALFDLAKKSSSVLDQIAAKQRHPSNITVASDTEETKEAIRKSFDNVRNIRST